MTSSSASAWLPTARPQRRRSRRPAAASSKAPQGGRGGRKREREGGGGGGGRPADRLPAGRTRQPQPDEGETHAAAHVTTEPARLICRAADARIAAASVRRERLAAVRSPATGTAARGHYSRAPRSTQNLIQCHGENGEHTTHNARRATPPLKFSPSPTRRAYYETSDAHNVCSNHFTNCCSCAHRRPVPPSNRKARTF